MTTNNMVDWHWYGGPKGVLHRADCKHIKAVGWATAENRVPRLAAVYGIKSELKCKACSNRDIAEAVRISQQ
jgi:hypothetical protein